MSGQEYMQADEFRTCSSVIEASYKSGSEARFLRARDGPSSARAYIPCVLKDSMLHARQARDRDDALGTHILAESHGVGEYAGPNRAVYKACIPPPCSPV